MEVKGTVKVVCEVRHIDIHDHPHTKQDFILAVRKPKCKLVDTIGLSLMDNDIEKYNISVGEKYKVIYDSTARVSNDGKGSEVFDRKIVHFMHKIVDKPITNETN